MEGLNLSGGGCCQRFRLRAALETAGPRHCLASAEVAGGTPLRKAQALDIGQDRCGSWPDGGGGGEGGDTQGTVPRFLCLGRKAYAPSQTRIKHSRRQL